jgi:hypothetical protein
VTQDGSIEARVDKPLTARQVRQAEWAAGGVKMAATKSAQNVVSKLGRLESDSKLAGDFVKVARFSGQAKERVIKDGVYDPLPGTQKASTLDRKAQYASSVQLLAAARLAEQQIRAGNGGDAAPAKVDLAGTAESLMRELARTAGISDEQLARDLHSQPQAEAVTLAQEIANQVAPPS